MKDKKRTKRIFRSAETGEFVSSEDAQANPKETYVDTVPVGTPEPESDVPLRDGNDYGDNDIEQPEPEQ